MSNSIWHKSGLEVPATDNKAKISRGGDIIYWTPYGWSHPKSYNHHRIGCEWAYLEDIIAQADKAERLQKQLNGQKKFSEALWTAWTQAKQDLEIARKALGKIAELALAHDDISIADEVIGVFDVLNQQDFADKIREQIEHKE